MEQCQKCGKDYETYAIILSNNPLSIASFLEETTNPDGTPKHLCKECFDIA